MQEGTGSGSDDSTSSVDSYLGIQGLRDFMEQNQETRRDIQTLDTLESRAPTRDPRPDTALRWVDLRGEGSYHAATQGEDGNWAVETWKQGTQWVQENQQGIKDFAEIVGPHIVQGTGRLAQRNYPVLGAVLTTAGVTLEAGAAVRRMVRYGGSAVQSGSAADWLRTVAAGIQTGTAVGAGLSYLPNTEANQALLYQGLHNVGTATGALATGATTTQRQAEESSLPFSTPLTTMPASSTLPAPTGHNTYGQQQDAAPNFSYPTPQAYPVNPANVVYSNTHSNQGGGNQDPGHGDSHAESSGTSYDNSGGVTRRGGYGNSGPVQRGRGGPAAGR
ncbi:hypothetical protein [Streptomyces sp. NBC_00370]|uniref:hypothetical protein n=1 Tax=Streptomyces sp. NBC_00370 TaxID=2975728 RepID=UPI002E2700F8